MTNIDDDKLRRIMRRAIEIDARTKGDLTEVELRAIADELGVSRAALDKALVDIDDHTDPQPAPDRPFWSPTGHILKWSAIGGAVMSIVMQGARELHMGTWPFTVLYGALLLIGCALAFAGESTKSYRMFLTRNAAFWAGFIAGGLLVSSTALSHQGLTDFLEAFGIRGWLLSSAFGLAIVVLRRTNTRRNGSVDGATSQRSIWGRIQTAVDSVIRRLEMTPTTPDTA